MLTIYHRAIRLKLKMEMGFIRLALLLGGSGQSLKSFILDKRLFIVVNGRVKKCEWYIRTFHV